MPRERLDDLPRHRLPRAARALRLPPRESRRSTASTPIAAPSSAPTATAPIRPPCARAARATPRVSGWWPIASLSLSVTLRPGESNELVFATGFAENAAEDKWASDGSPNVAAARRLRARLQDPQHVERALSTRIARRWDALLDTLAGQHAGRAAERARQHLESVPVHGDVPARAQRVAVRDRPRPRHRLPRFEPGLPRRRAHGPGRGARAADAPRRHAEERRQRLSPVPAADADRQRRDRRRLQRRPAVARARASPLTCARPGRADLLDAIVPFEDAPDGGATMRDHLEASLRLHAGAARRARAAADRPRRLERLPQPQRALDRSGRVVPDRADAHERPRGVGDDRARCSCWRRATTPRSPSAADGDAAKYRAAADTMATAVETHGWDGDWFLRAYDDAGQPVGSRRNAEGQIFLEPQALCAMAGIGADSGLRRSRAAERRRAARLPIRRAAARSAVPQLSQRARRDLDLPAGLQGKRLGVLPHQSVGHHRRGACAAAPTARCRSCAPSRRPTRPTRTRAAPSPTCTRRWSPARRRRRRARRRIPG